MIINNGWYAFKENKGCFLYDFESNIILKLSEKAYSEFIEQNEGRSFKWINDLKDLGIFRSKIEISDKLYEDVAYLSFAPVYKCNFRCTYCFGKYGEQYGGRKTFTENELDEMLEFFWGKLFPDASHYRIDFVSGGEPLMGIPVLDKTFDYIREFERKTGKTVSKWLCTNGSLLTKDTIRFIKKNKVQVGVSFDGNKDYHDKNRIDQHGNGTYETVLQGIKLFQSESISDRQLLWGLCTATNDNCDFVEILRNMKQIGFGGIQIRLERSSGNYDVEKIIREYRRLTDFLLIEYSERRWAHLRLILNDNDQFGKILKRLIVGGFLVRRCNAGINKVTMCPEGEIYICDSMVGHELGMIGNWKEKTCDLSKFRSITINSIEDCKCCNVNILCGGDCYYNSLQKNNEIHIPDQEYCKIQRALIELAITMRFTMEQSNSALFKAIKKDTEIRNVYSEIYG